MSTSYKMCEIKGLPKNDSRFFIYQLRMFKLAHYLSVAGTALSAGQIRNTTCGEELINMCNNITLPNGRQVQLVPRRVRPRDTGIPREKLAPLTSSSFIYMCSLPGTTSLPTPLRGAKLLFHCSSGPQYELICIQPIRDRACQYRTHLHTANPPRVIQP